MVFRVVSNSGESVKRDKSRVSGTPMARIALAMTLFAGLAAAHAFGATLFEQGVNALREDQPQKAQALLKASLADQPNNEETYLYLGIADLQLGNLNAAIGAFKQGLTFSGKYTSDFYFNLGNIYFMQGQNTLAEGMYSMAIKANANFADAYLNRANARMRLQSYDSAVQDYTVYLSLDPGSPQRASIEQLIALLTQQKADAARQQQLAEQQKLAEEAKQKQLLNDVLQSLQNASNNTKNLQAGTAGFQSTKPKLGLDD